MAPSSRARLLVVEDDEQVQEQYQWFFDQAHKGEFLWVAAPTGQRALLVLERHPSPPVDLMVLDWKLPDMEGLALLRRIRSTPALQSIRVLMVTALDSTRDAARALEAGADDYLRKPFGNDELLARLHALLRRGRTPLTEGNGALRLEGLALEPKARSVSLYGESVHLADKEFDLLALFLRRPAILHTAGYLAEVLSSKVRPLSAEAVRKHVSNLRKALSPWSRRIQVHWGRGYSLSAARSRR